MKEFADVAIQIDNRNCQISFFERKLKKMLSRHYFIRKEIFFINQNNEFILKSLTSLSFTLSSLFNSPTSKEEKGLCILLYVFTLELLKFA